MDHKITSETIQNAFLVFLTQEKLPKLLKSLPEGELMSDKSFVISDYGCAGGRTTFVLCDEIIRFIHSKNPNKIIQIYMNDLPQNDFRITFKEALEHYSQADKVYVFAIGKSFYSQVLPPRKAHIVLSCYSVQWLEHQPSPLQNDLIGSRKLTDQKEKKAWVEQASKDLKKFFELRSKELVKGGHLFISIPGMKGHGTFFNLLQKHKKQVLAANGLDLVSPYVVCNSYVWDDEECRNVMKSVKDLYTAEEITSLHQTVWKYDESQPENDAQYKEVSELITNSFKEVLENLFKSIIAEKTLELYNQKLSEQELSRMYNQMFRAASLEMTEKLKKYKELVFLNVLAWGIAN